MYQAITAQSKAQDAQLTKTKEALQLLVIAIEDHYTKGGKFVAPGQIELAYYNAKNALKA